MTRRRRSQPSIPITPEWIATVEINDGQREFKPGDPITPDDLPADVWDALVDKGRIAKPTPPEPPRKGGLYRVIAAELTSGGQSWPRDAIVDARYIAPEDLRTALEDDLVEPAGDPLPDRAERWEAESVRLRARLDAAQRQVLEWAALGNPPFSWWMAAKANFDTEMAQAIDKVEAATRGMLGAYEWPETPDGPPAHGWREVHRWDKRKWRPVGPNWQPEVDTYNLDYSPPARRFDQWPSFRGELLELLRILAGYRAAKMAGHHDSAAMVAMVAGMKFCRLSLRVIEGSKLARVTSTDLKWQKTSLIKEWRDRQRAGPWVARVRQLDEELRTRWGKMGAASERARLIRPKLAEWMMSEGLVADESEVPKAGTIRKELRKAK